jgi:hypothetical protein
MRRATRQITALRPEYEGDVRRVLREIDALPPVERAWTLLMVRADQGQIEPLVPDANLVAALKQVGPDRILTFLRREVPLDDPDVRAGPAYRGSMTGIVLDHAPALLRPSDADDVEASAEAFRRLDNNTWFVAAASRLRGMVDPIGAAESLKANIRDIPPERLLGVRDQATLATALWLLSGDAEAAFLVEWFYSAVTIRSSSIEVHRFLERIIKENRTDTPQLLRSLVGHPRFDELLEAPLVQVMEMANQTLAAPLVQPEMVFRYRQYPKEPDQRQTPAVWRRLLREQFGTAR